MGNPVVRILLVDDDSKFRGVFAKFFARYPDFEIYEAANGQEGLYKARDILPDLILSDYDMPLLDGNDPRAREPADVVFMSTPDGVGMKLAAAELAAGARVIDYSGDFRFNSPEAYADYATRIGRNPAHAAPPSAPVR